MEIDRISIDFTIDDGTPFQQVALVECLLEHTILNENAYYMSAKRVSDKAGENVVDVIIDELHDSLELPHEWSNVSLIDVLIYYGLGMHASWHYGISRFAAFRTPLSQKKKEVPSLKLVSYNKKGKTKKNK